MCYLCRHSCRARALTATCRCFDWISVSTTRPNKIAPLAESIAFWQFSAGASRMEVSHVTAVCLHVAECPLREKKEGGVLSV
jgi:hypothetical protein